MLCVRDGLREKEVGIALENMLAGAMVPCDTTTGILIYVFRSRRQRALPPQLYLDVVVTVILPSLAIVSAIEVLGNDYEHFTSADMF